MAIGIGAVTLPISKGNPTITINNPQSPISIVNLQSAIVNDYRVTGSIRS
jgi:hypothetical protein